MKKGSVKEFLESLSKRKTIWVLSAIFLIFPLITPSRYYMVLLAEVFIWALLAMSYDLALGYTGLVSFGQAAPFGIGAYSAALLMGMGIPFLLAIVIAILFGAVTGMVLGVFARRMSGIYYALVTLAFAEVIFAVFSKWVQVSGGETGIAVIRPDIFRSDVFLYFALAISSVALGILFAIIIRYMSRSTESIRKKALYLVLLIVFVALIVTAAPSRLNLILTGSGRDRIITIEVMNVYYFLALIPLILSYLVAKRIVDSPIGRVFVAIRENEERAEMLGYNSFNYKLISSTISAIFAGLAGALYAPFILQISPASVLSSAIMINVLLYSILGGLGTLIGPMLGAGIITILADELTSIPSVGQYWMLILGIFYILVILFLPYGIILTWRVKGASARKVFQKLATSLRKSLKGEAGQ
jgi:branched-chain amino acid transport system permease protein